MTERYCKDCRWYRPRDGQPSFSALCDHPTSVSPAKANLVTGEVILERRWTCTDMRSFDAWGEYCGREGRHWEPIKTGFV